MGSHIALLEIDTCVAREKKLKESVLYILWLVKRHGLGRKRHHAVRKSRLPVLENVYNNLLEGFRVNLRYFWARLSTIAKLTEVESVPIT